MMTDRRRGAGFTVLALVAGVALASLGYAVSQGSLGARRAGVDSPVVGDGLGRGRTPAQPVAPTARPGPTVVPSRGTGRFTPAPDGGTRVGTGRLLRYRVEVEQGAGQSAVEFAQSVAATLADPRGWTATKRWAFQRVPLAAPADFMVRLATPGTVDRLCAAGGFDTGGEVSCQVNATVVINLKRWLLATDVYAGDVAGYRHLVVNHEVGHFLGFGHVDCPGPGKPAPVMQAQIWGLHGCVPNVWPYPDQH